MRGTFFVALFLAIVTLVAAAQPASPARTLHLYARQEFGPPDGVNADSDGSTEDVPSDAIGSTDLGPSATPTDAASDANGTTNPEPGATTTSPSAGNSTSPSASPSNASGPTLDPCEDMCIAPRNLNNMCAIDPGSQSCLKICEPDTWNNSLLPCLRCRQDTIPELAQNVTEMINGHDAWCDEVKASFSAAAAAASATASVSGPASASGPGQSGSAAPPACGVPVVSVWGLVVGAIGAVVAL